MKICFLAAANSIHSYRWIKYFADNGHEIHWISLALSSFDDIENGNFYEIKQLPVKVLSILWAMIRVKKLVKKIKPDVLHAHYAGTYGLLGAIAGVHPFVITVWGSDILFASKSVIKGLFIKFALKKAELITSDANHMRDAMIKLGVDPIKVNIIYFGTDTLKFRPGKKSETLRSKLEIFDLPMIISLRNLEPIYDVKSLINSIHYVLEEVPEAKFVIAGKGSEKDKLKKLAKSLEVSESIRFVGEISSDELPRYLTSSDIYVSTSLSDAGLSASAAEAMACGLPVIVTDSGENREWVENGKNGFIVSLSNPQTLAEKIIYLLKNGEVRLKYGSINRRIIEERNNYYIEMEKMQRIYRELIENNE
jgi:glycosyltransferase involved in cell wall biosynthesis